METYRPLAINEWQLEWDELPAGDRARLRARQEAPNIIARPLRVLDEDGRDVPVDGQTIGEIAVSGNDVMLGYYRDKQATSEVTRGGCFLTGYLAVMHPADGPAARINPTSRIRSSEDDAQGQLRRAAALHQPGDLVPVEVVGEGLGQRPGDAEPGEPFHPPVVHKHLVAGGGLAGDGCFHS
jgi:fatty-acyl-CoA synthase